jgi:hypothetical protein
MRILALAGVVVLAGCMPIGADFVRPDSTQLKLGATTRDEILERYGKPRSERSVTQSNLVQAAAIAGAPFGVGNIAGTMSEIDYYYEYRLGEGTTQGVQPSKSARFWFHDEKLVGYLSHSSFRADSTTFDPDKVSAVVPWKTVRADVLKRLGEPSGARIYPMVPRPGQEILSYFAFEFDRGANETRIKRFHVLIGVLGVVEEVRFDSSAKPIPAPVVPNYVPVPYYYTPPRTNSNRTLRR